MKYGSVSMTGIFELIMSPADWAIMPVALPLLGAALSLLAKAFIKKGPLAKLFEYLGAFVGLALPWLALAALAPLVLRGESVQAIIGSWSPLVGISFRFDGLTWLVDMLGFSVAGMAWLYSVGAGPKGPAFTTIYLIQASALAATAATTDLFNLFVCLEVLGMASYVLVTSSEKPGAFLAAFSYLMVSAAAMVFFLLGVYGLYRLTGSLSYTSIASALALMPDGGGYTAVVSIACISAAVALRVAVMPLYGWLPDAHALAPHAVSAVLSGVLIKTPLFALSRFLLAMPGGGLAGELFGYAGALTALGGVIIALSQKDAKRLLAYHSISQIGYVVSAWGAGVAALSRGESAGYALLSAAFLHAFYHALFKGLLFLTVGTATDAAAERDVYILRGAGAALKKSGERLPFTLLAFAVGALSISALPPFNGFVSKAALSYVLKGRWEYFFLFLAGIGTTASFMKLAGIFGPPKRNSSVSMPSLPQGKPAAPSVVAPASPGLPAAAPLYKAKKTVLIAQCILALACVAGGIAGPWFYRFVGSLLSGGSRSVSVLRLYDIDSLLNMGAIVLAGYALYKLALTGIGKRIAARIRERPRGFHGLFAAFSLGLGGLTLWISFFRFQ
jgi:multicomponent Na+:H+ antiporter subunit D